MHRVITSASTGLYISESPPLPVRTPKRETSARILMLLIALRRHLFGGALIPEIPLFLLCDAPILRCDLYLYWFFVYRILHLIPIVYLSCLPWQHVSITDC